MLKKLLISIVIVTSLVFSFVTFNAAPVQDTVEGEGSHFVTGESFPSKLEVSGYNSRDQKLYLNMEFTTTRTVTGKTPTFNYYINIFDGNGSLLGNAGNITTPEAKVGTMATATTTIANKELILTTPLSAAYRTIVTINSVQLN